MGPFGGAVPHGTADMPVTKMCGDSCPCAGQSTSGTPGPQTMCRQFFLQDTGVPLWVASLSTDALL